MADNINDDNSSLRPFVSLLPSIVILIVICVLEFHTIRITESFDLPYQVKFAQGIVLRTPLERVFQNRLLAPWLVQIIAMVTRHSYAASYATAELLLLSVANAICFFLMLRITASNVMALAWTAAYGALVIVLQDEMGMYIFDLVDLSTMLIFVYAVLYSPNNNHVLIPLFFVELLNRESAGFVALWIIINGWGRLIMEPLPQRERSKIWSQVLIGGGLLVFGTLWTKLVRRFLFLHSYDARIGVDMAHWHNGEHYVLLANLRNFLPPFHPGFFIAVVNCYALGYIVVRLVKFRGKRTYAFAAIIGAMLISAWLFGNVDEARIWLEFAPFLLLTAHFISTNGRRIRNSKEMVPFSTTW